MSRIKLTDSASDVLFKLSEGNPGALNVLIVWLREGKNIDPYCEPLLSMLFLDTLNIVGPSIWVMFKDICGSDIRTFIGVLRACQLGCISDAVLRHAIATGGGLDIQWALAEVERQLPNFQKKIQQAEGEITP